MAHTGVYHNFGSEKLDGVESEDVVTRDVEVTTGLWSGETGSLTSFFTSTTQLAKANASYFVNVYDKDPASDSTAAVQYSLAYGHVSGAGSPTLAQDDTSTLSTKAVYFQFKNALLDNPEDSLFSFQNSTTSQDIYAISISRARFKSVVDPGNFQLTLSGSNGLFTFIDDSLQALGTRRSFARSGNTFNIVSGSISGVSGSTIVGPTASNGEGYGTFYPQKGIMILNPSAIADTVGFDAQSENTTGNAATDLGAAVNPEQPFTASLTNNPPREQHNWIGLHRSIVLGADFQARSSETVSSQHFFIRLRNNHATTSNNPTWINEADAKVQIEDFEYDPKVFITTVGLYNDQNELLAVAKLSRPLEKSLTKEALIRVRLDF
jgi:hypothetical protein